MSPECTVVETFVKGKCPEVECEDFVVVGPRFIGVVDGSSKKPWTRGPSGGSVAESVRDVLESVRSEIPFLEVVEMLTREAASRYDETSIDRELRSCATVAVYDVVETCVWRLGDPAVLFDGMPSKDVSERERSVAVKRAGRIRRALDEGASVDSIREFDPGRIAIEDDLRILARSRNAVVDGSFAAVDGMMIPVSLVECLRPTDIRTEIVIASDGYPDPRGTLIDSESALSSRLARDPLMIEDPAQTKGVGRGCESFDDRSYVRLRLEP